MTANNVPCRLCSFLKEWGHAASLNVMPTGRVSARLHGGRVLRHWTSAPDASCLQQQYFLSALAWRDQIQSEPNVPTADHPGNAAQRQTLWTLCENLSCDDFVEKFSDRQINRNPLVLQKQRHCSKPCGDCMLDQCQYGDFPACAFLSDLQEGSGSFPG